MGDYWGFDKYSLTMQSEVQLLGHCLQLTPHIIPVNCPIGGSGAYNIDRRIMKFSFDVSRLYDRIIYLHCSIQMVSEDERQLLPKQVSI